MTRRTRSLGPPSRLIWPNGEIIENAVGDVISIHMNKFQDSRVSGPMVFYHKDSEEGKNWQN